jgi:hypothetical protein
MYLTRIIPAGAGVRLSRINISITCGHACSQTVRPLTRLGRLVSQKRHRRDPVTRRRNKDSFAQRLFSGVNDTGEGLRLVTKRPEKITLAEMRGSGVRGL